MFDINKLDFTPIYREDNPIVKSAKNKDKLHSVIYDYETPDNPKGLEVLITSMLSDEDKNSYNRYESMLIHNEQKHYPDFNNNLLAELMQLVIRKHGHDLAIPEELVKVPTIKELLDFIESS